MISAGIDIGSMTAKAVVMKDRRVIASAITLTGPDGGAAAEGVFDQALHGASLNRGDVTYIVATGYGRVNVPFANKRVTEITCHARAAHGAFPGVRTILDMGGQDCKAIRVNGRGQVVNFVLNDKCAAGTGRYLERVARLLGLTLEEIGERSLDPVQGPLPVDNACAVFAENDVLTWIRAGHHPNDILAGATDALVSRIVPLLNRVGVEADFSISGGVAKNVGLVSRLETRLGLKAAIAKDPQLIGAMGAAMIAEERAVRRITEVSHARTH